MTPYLILDEALCQAVENAALPGVQVKLILPGIPDTWIVKELACSHYERLMKAGVEIYEYEPGFVHARSIWRTMKLLWWVPLTWTTVA